VSATVGDSVAAFTVLIPLAPLIIQNDIANSIIVRITTLFIITIFPSKQVHIPTELKAIPYTTKVK
jgi:hypothetical protein